MLPARERPYIHGSSAAGEKRQVAKPCWWHRGSEHTRPAHGSVCKCYHGKYLPPRAREDADERRLVIVSCLYSVSAASFGCVLAASTFVLVRFPAPWVRGTARLQGCCRACSESSVAEVALAGPANGSRKLESTKSGMSSVESTITRKFTLFEGLKWLGLVEGLRLQLNDACCLGEIFMMIYGWFFTKADNKSLM